MQCEVQSGYSECAYLFIDQRSFAPLQRRPGYVRHVCATTSCSSGQLPIMHCYSNYYQQIRIAIVQEQVLKYIHTCTASSPHLRNNNVLHKRIRVTHMFTRKKIVVQCYPQNILTSNYFQTTALLIPCEYVHSYGTAQRKCCFHSFSTDCVAL